MFFVGGDDVRQFRAARAAPRRPEINQHHFAFERTTEMGLPLESLSAKSGTACVAKHFILFLFCLGLELFHFPLLVHGFEELHRSFSEFGVGIIRLDLLD